jgi:hypothetical protein
MRRLINRFACWIIGHNWRVTGEKWLESHQIIYSYECRDCGKEKEYER